VWRFERKIEGQTTTTICLAATLSCLFLALVTLLIWKTVAWLKAKRRIEEQANPVLAYQNLLDQERIGKSNF